MRRRGAPPEAAWAGDPLRPGLAIDALVAAACALFDLHRDDGKALLAPALADWRDAVGCADPLLVPADAQGAGADARLLPLPMPSWCAWLLEAGVLRLEGAPALDGPRVVQRALLLTIREAELTAVECFPLIFAGRFLAGEESLRLHLAISPPFFSATWRGSVCVRAAAHRARGGPVPLWAGPPSRPGDGAAQGMEGEAVTTWARPAGSASRWLVVRALEGREPQALWDLAALGAPAESPAEAAGPPAALRLAIDLGSTATVVVEEDSAAAGPVGAKLLAEHAGRAPSGFRLLAGDAATAHLYGCSEALLARGGQLPTALAGSGPLLARLLAGERVEDQLWLPQAPMAPGAAEVPAGLLLADRFKSPELLVLSEWLSALPAGPERARGAVSRRLLESYGYLLGRTLAAAHATPLVSAEGGGWTTRRPRLGGVEAVLTYPECAWGGEAPFQQVFDAVGRETARGLGAAWSGAGHQLIADPAAARAAREQPHDQRHPVEVFADFGGLTLQVTVRVPRQPGRPAPLLTASSMSYLLGGERLIDAGALAMAADAPDLRAGWREAARALRTLIASGDHLRDPALAKAAHQAVLAVVFALVQRQLEGTLRRAAPDLSTLRGAGVRLYLLGEGWKLAALDAADAQREPEAQRRIAAHLETAPLLGGTALRVERMTKRRLCEGALRVRVPPEPEPSVELQGVDLASEQGQAQRWFGVPAKAAPPGLALQPDAWWRQLHGGGAASLLRVEQWFNAPAPFDSGLSGGRVAFDARRSVLKQWLDVCGPSLFALRIHRALGQRP